MPGGITLSVLLAVHAPNAQQTRPSATFPTKPSDLLVIMKISSSR
jgi:hypothetical protein